MTSTKPSQVTATGSFASPIREAPGEDRNGFPDSGFSGMHHSTSTPGPSCQTSNFGKVSPRQYSHSGWDPWDSEESGCEAEDEGDRDAEPLRRSVHRSQRTEKTTKCHMCKKKKPEGEMISIRITNITNWQPHPWCLECRTKYSEMIEDDPDRSATDLEGLSCIGFLVPSCATGLVKNGLCATRSFLESEEARDTRTQLLSVARDMWRAFARGNGSHYS